MNENEIKKAFDEIEPENGAQERMYANILKKAAVRNGTQTDAPVQQDGEPLKTDPLHSRRPIPMWKRYSAIAACLALMATLTIGFLHPFFARDGEGEEPPVMGGSPFEDVQSAADFERLGFSIDAPEGAEEVSYCILDGEIAQVNFTLDGHSYLYRAAELSGDFSGAGSVTFVKELDAVHDAVLECAPDVWRVRWNDGGVQYYLLHFGDAGEEAVTAAAELLFGQG